MDWFIVGLVVSRSVGFYLGVSDCGFVFGCDLGCSTWGCVYWRFGMFNMVHFGVLVC